MRHKIVFLDLDGTVNSSSSVRDHLIPTQPQHEANWAAWHSAHTAEKPNQAVIDVVRALCDTGWRIVVLSMRGDQFGDSTSKQLKTWGCPFDSWILKAPGDSRAPGVYKRDQINDFVIAAWHLGQVVDILVIDDSQEVHKAVREIVIPESTAGCSHINVLEVTPFKG